MTAVAPQIISSDNRWYLEHVLTWPQGEKDGRIIISHTMGKGHWVDEAVRTPLEALAAIRRRAADPKTVGIFASQARMRPHDRQKRSADLRLSALKLGSALAVAATLLQRSHSVQTSCVVHLIRLAKAIAANSTFLGCRSRTKRDAKIYA